MSIGGLPGSLNWIPIVVHHSMEIQKTIRWRGAHFTCSINEEAIHWLQTGVPQNFLVAVFTDSQSLCAAQLGKFYRPRRPQIQGLRRQITIQWIPGHCDILGNEMADL